MPQPSSPSAASPPAQQEFDLYLNLAKPTLGLYTPKGAGLPDLAHPREWRFSGHIWQSELAPALLKELQENGHAFQELGG
ncbi:MULTISPECIES: hypothetical protein [unclassified Achromobacter]|uniref:hypothetical protein n=1 Tax=unclassified Achromobacter TaxID=2626865 RepID=UPI00069F55FD|nr:MULTISPECIES: hypothetical protein [unclassified Achromobacter]KOF53637.1 hypothetical protein AD428_12325 [Achromobacter sp. DMS1]KOF53638.1 hypothetical protein AD428_12335 [Achromobacter sp. DMS1]